MTATPVSAGTDLARTEARESGRIGHVVLGSITAGFVLGLLLVLVLVAGGSETEITGGALLALGSGFVLLAVGSIRFTDQPQRWALPPGLAAVAIGVVVIVLAPSDRILGLAGWIWPALLLILVGWSFRCARRSLQNWSRAVLLNPALFLLALIAFGGAFETVAQAGASNPAPVGRTYLVHGHRLYLSCVGTGAPTVLLFNGLGERTPSWAWVQRIVAASTRVCVFDRAGEGWSGSAPGPRDGHQLAFDLHGLLRAAHVPGPYVLAGHSTGGTYGLVYALAYPRDVAGIALIDSATPYQFDLPDYPAFYSMWRRAGALLPSVARTGIGRLTLRAGFDGLPPKARGEARDFASSPRELQSDRIEFAQLPRIFNQAKPLKTLHGKPLAVLTADLGEQSGWAAAQDKLARLSSNSVHEKTAGATHSALLEDHAFAALTSRVIGDVVYAVRSGLPLGR